MSWGGSYRYSSAGGLHRLAVADSTTIAQLLRAMDSSAEVGNPAEVDEECNL